MYPEAKEKLLQWQWRIWSCQEDCTSSRQRLLLVFLQQHQKSWRHWSVDLPFTISRAVGKRNFSNNPNHLNLNPLRHFEKTMVEYCRLLQTIEGYDRLLQTIADFTRPLYAVVDYCRLLQTITENWRRLDTCLTFYVTKMVHFQHCVLGRPPFQHTVANGIVYASYIFSIAQQWQEAGYIAALEALFFLLLS